MQIHVQNAAEHTTQQPPAKLLAKPQTPIEDNRLQTTQLKSLQAMMDNSPQVKKMQTLQPRTKTNLPLQTQGRVKPTLQMKASVPVNDDTGLETEADLMGERAVAQGAELIGGHRRQGDMPEFTPRLATPADMTTGSPVQRVIYNSMANMWTAVEPTRTEPQIKAITNADTALTQAYGDVEQHLGQMDFIYTAGKQPEADFTNNAGVYNINYGLRNELQAPYTDVTRYVAAILHEMMHITAGLQYTTNVASGSVGHFANMHIPASTGGAVDPEFGMTDNQFDTPAMGAVAQMDTIVTNWDSLSQEAALDVTNGDLTTAQQAFIDSRITYAKIMPGALAHYDTVLTDLLFILQSEGAGQSRSYDYAHRMLAEANARRIGPIAPVGAINRAPLPIPAPPAQSFWEYITACFGCQPMAIDPTARRGSLEQEADVMGQQALEVGHNTTGVTQLHSGVVQRGTGSSTAKETEVVEYHRWDAGNAEYSFAWDNNTINVSTTNDSETAPVGFARYTLETIDIPSPPPGKNEPYSFEHVKGRSAGRVAHLTKIWNNTLTREGPNDIYSGFAMELMTRVEQKAKAEGATLIYLEPSATPIRVDPNNNVKKSSDPTGFYTGKCGYGYDDIALLHNEALIDQMFQDNPGAAEEAKKTMIPALLGGTLQKNLL